MLGLGLLLGGALAGHALARAYLWSPRAQDRSRAVQLLPAAPAAPPPRVAAVAEAEPAGAAGAAAVEPGLPPRVLEVLGPGAPRGGLHGAVLDGELDAITQALEAGARPDAPDPAGRTALSLAALAGREQAFEVLLQAGASLTATSHDGRTHLAWTAAADQESMVRRLIALGLRIDAPDRHGDTPLIAAARHDAAEAASVLLDAGARIDTQGEAGMTALMHAARRAPGPLLRGLLERRPALEARDRRGATALMHAADALQPGAAADLLDAGAKIDAANHAGLTPLGYALSKRSGLSVSERADADRVAELLAGRGADLRLLRAPQVARTLDRARHDALALRHGQPSLPAELDAAPDALPPHIALAPDGASVRLLALRPRSRSRTVPAQIVDALQIRVWGQGRAASAVQRVRVRGLSPRPDQRLTLAGDGAGQWGFSVDDVLLFETGDPRRVRRRAYVGIAEELRLQGDPIARLGHQAFQFGADQVEVTDLFIPGQDVYATLLDWGGRVMNSDVFLRVIGPHAVDTLRKVRVEVVP